MELAGKRIVLGVTGGIAAYKAAELVRLLIKEGASVHVAVSYTHLDVYKRQAAGRPILLAEIRSLYNKVERYVRALLSVTTEMPKTQREHTEILGAFVRRDPDAAAELTRAHVLDAGASLVSYLNDHRSKGGNK